MLNIESILRYMLDSINNQGERFRIVDDECVLDTTTGVEYHLYDDWFKLTRDGQSIAMKNDFTPQEQEVIWHIKQAITDPETAKKREVEYPLKQKERRQMLSDYYENPKPVMAKHPLVEEGTYEYTG